ncbi:MAG TPA: TIGR03067 domain-containing protein [Steroidobacteraceae bacterium]|nr:TIGR03067 domain-containing protein [Steroidobacteraceae bacterium]
MLDGTWIATSAILGGNSFPAPVLATIRLTLNAGQYTLGNDHGTYRTDDRAFPAAIDVAGSDGPNKGRQIPAIYELTGDTLTICYDLACEARPKAFQSAAASKHFLVTYRRA